MTEELDRLMEEAAAQAGIYCEAWTNRNASDPGITILESMTILHLLQKETAGQVTDEARLLLLRLTGFTPREAEHAILPVEVTEAEEPVSFPKHQKFYVDNVCFETEEEVRKMQGCLLGVYVKEQEGFRELRELKRGAPLNARPFGNSPAAGDAVYFLFQELPRGRKVKVQLYVQIRESGKRNPFTEEEPVQFARLQWSCHTGDGYEDIAFEDDTCGFLKSGVTALWLDRDKLVKERAGTKEGYMLCCRILDAAYDSAPEITAVHGPLFYLVQRDTQSFSQTFHGRDNISLYPVFPEDTFITVYVCESGRTDYLRYEAAPLGGEPDRCGRYYELSNIQDGKMRIHFDKKKFGFGPAEEQGAVFVICCCRNMMLHRELGVLEGYDNQCFDCTLLGSADKRFLCLGTRSTGGLDEGGCRFFRPGINREDSVFYTYDEEKRQICIHDAGPYTGYQVFLTDYAVSVWEAGNIRFGNTLKSAGGNAGIMVRNPVRGREGRRNESVQEVVKRFVQDRETPVSAVTAQDYEVLARQVPGLCIRKVSAYYDERRERVCTVVMPWSEDSFPRLSPLYRRQIETYLDKRKLLSVQVTVKEPSYIPVDVYVTVSVRNRESWSEKKVRQEITEAVDDRRNNRKIGQKISFGRLSTRIRACPGAGYILELKVIPAGVPARLIRPGADIEIPPDAACYPHEIVIREE